MTLSEEEGVILRPGRIAIGEGECMNRKKEQGDLLFNHDAFCDPDPEAGIESTSLLTVFLEGIRIERQLHS